MQIGMVGLWVKRIKMKLLTEYEIKNKCDKIKNKCDQMIWFENEMTTFQENFRVLYRNDNNRNLNNYISYDFST